MTTTRKEINNLQLVSVYQGKPELLDAQPLVVGESFEMDLSKVQMIGDETLYEVIQRLCSEHHIQFQSKQKLSMAPYQSVVAVLDNEYEGEEEEAVYLPVYHAGEQTKRVLVFHAPMNGKGDLKVDLMKITGQEACLGRNSKIMSLMRPGKGSLVVFVEFNVQPFKENSVNECHTMTAYHAVSKKPGESLRSHQLDEVGDRHLVSIHLFGVDAVKEYTAAIQRVAILSHQFEYAKSYHYSVFLQEMNEFVKNKYQLNQADNVIGHTMARLGGMQDPFVTCVLKPNNEAAALFSVAMSLPRNDIGRLVDLLKYQFGDEFCELDANVDGAITFSLVSIQEHLAEIMDCMDSLFLLDPLYLDACQQYSLLKDDAEKDFKKLFNQLRLSQCAEKICRIAHRLNDNVDDRYYGNQMIYNELGLFASAVSTPETSKADREKAAKRVNRAINVIEKKRGADIALPSEADVSEIRQLIKQSGY